MAGLLLVPASVHTRSMGGLPCRTVFSPPELPVLPLVTPSAPSAPRRWVHTLHTGSGRKAGSQPEPRAILRRPLPLVLQAPPGPPRDLYLPMLIRISRETPTHAVTLLHVDGAAHYGTKDPMAFIQALEVST